MSGNSPQSRENSLAPHPRKWLPPLILTILVFAVFANTLSSGFVFDDVSMIKNNPAIRDPKYIELYFTRPFFSVGRPTAGPVAYDYYRPMVLLSYLADYAMWGLGPRGWHFCNIFLHAAASVLVYLLLGRLKLGTGASFAGAAIFSIHPALADSVAGVSGRSDPLCAIFFLTSMLCYLGARREKSIKALALQSCSCFAFALALLSKENAIALPLVLAAYELIRPDDAAQRKLRSILPFCFIALAYFLWRSQVVPVSLSFSGDNLELAQRIMTAAKVSVGYVLIMFYPRGLGFETFTPMTESIAEPAALACTLAVVLAMGAVVLLRKSSAQIAFFTMWFFICMSPFCYFFLFHPEPEFFTPPHFLYFPSIGLTAIAGIGIAGLAKHTANEGKSRYAKAVPAASAFIVVLFAVQTMQRGMLWRNDFTFFSAMVRFAPRSARVHIGMANSLMKNGRPGLALAEYARALELARARAGVNAADLGTMPGTDKKQALGWIKISDYYAAAALAGMGDAYGMIGETDNSIRSYREALTENAFDAAIHVKLARACERAGRFEMAIESYERALRLDRGLRDAASSLEIVRRKKELFEVARSVRQTALGLDQEDSTAALYSEALMTRLGGEKGVAEALLRRVLKKDPTHFGANMALGRILTENGENGAALGNFSAAFAAEPSSPLAAYEMAVTNLILRDTLAAEQWAAKAYDLSPNTAYWDFLQDVRGIRESGPDGK